MNEATHVALVTGGAQGIGKGIATRFLKEGWAVAIADIDPEAGRETARELGGMGQILFVQADVSREAPVKKMVQRTIKQFGRIDALINNAGISVGKPLDKLTLADWHKVIDTNLTSVFLCAKYATPHLRKGKGAMVNIASTRAVMSEAGTVPYSASKGGVVAITHSLAVSLGPDVRVNCILPGWIDVTGWRKSSRRKQVTLSPLDHSQHPAGRVGTPEDIAALAWFLASPEAGFITGASFVADGGMTRKMIYVE